jgi:hypothetical protein
VPFASAIGFTARYTQQRSCNSLKIRYTLPCALAPIIDQGWRSRKNLKVTACTRTRQSRASWLSYPTMTQEVCAHDKGLHTKDHPGIHPTVRPWLNRSDQSYQSHRGLSSESILFGVDGESQKLQHGLYFLPGRSG